MYKTQFIVIDGLDASGKTTQAYLLANFLRGQGKTVCLRIHPSSDNIFGIRAKGFLQSIGKNAHFAAAFFYMVDVLHSILQYSWREYDYIIFVRYLMGTAYLPSPIDKLTYCFFASIVPKSEKMFFIDIKPEVAYDRIVNRKTSTIEMFEKPDSLKKMRRKGLALASFGKWTIVEGGRSIAEVESKIRSLLEQPRT